MPKLWAGVSHMVRHGNGVSSRSLPYPPMSPIVSGRRTIRLPQNSADQGDEDGLNANVSRGFVEMSRNDARSLISQQQVPPDFIGQSRLRGGLRHRRVTAL